MTVQRRSISINMITEEDAWYSDIDMILTENKNTFNS